jgi:hypothetical protein
MGRQVERPTVEILDEPSSFQRELQERRAEGSGEMRPALAPVQTRARKSAPRLAA